MTHSRSKSIIQREFRTVTGHNKAHIELDNHILVSKKRIEKTVGDRIKKKDIITEYTIDDGKPLLEKIYTKEWIVNKYPEISKKTKTYRED